MKGADRGLSLLTEPVLEDVCQAVKRQVEAQRQAALKERARLLPPPPSPGATAAAATGTGAAGSSPSPVAAAQRALHRLRASLEGLPVLAAEDLRLLTAQAHGHLQAFLQATATATAPAAHSTAAAAAAGDAASEKGEIVDLAVTMHALVSFVLQAASASAVADVGGQKDAEAEALRSLRARRAAVVEVVRTLPALWRRLRDLEGAVDGAGVRTQVFAFCEGQGRRLLRALLEWGDGGEEEAAAASPAPAAAAAVAAASVGGGSAGSVQNAAADWWLEVLAAGALTPVQAESAWLSLLLAARNRRCCTAADVVAAKLIDRYHHQGGGAAALKGKGEVGYHPLHFSRLGAVLDMDK